MLYPDAPRNWAICFQGECPLAATCLRHAMALLAPDGLTHHHTVLPALRERMMGVFGSRAHYYRYRSGRYDITPGQQERLAALFRHFGYTQPLHFDHTTEQYFFPKP